MKVVIILHLILMVIAMASVSMASPFLVSEPTTEEITHYELSFNGGTWIQSAPQTVTGGVRLHYDLAGLPIGNHTVVARACNIWGCSVNSVPFSFSKSVPSKPSGLGLER